MKAVFIADAHLREKESARYAAVLEFLSQIRGNSRGDVSSPSEKPGISAPVYPLAIDRLYILGDFFDFWFHKADAIYPDFSLVIEKLIELKRQGVLISLCEGNHDFFLGEYFSEKLGMSVFNEWGLVQVDGWIFLVSHGDTIDTENKKYLLLRRVLRSNFFYRIQRKLPLSFLWMAAKASSKLSNDLSIESSEALAIKMRHFSMAKFEEGFDAVILGHCHTPICEEHVINGRRKNLRDSWRLDQPLHVSLL